MARNSGLAVLAVLAVVLWSFLLLRQPQPPSTGAASTGSASTGSASDSSAPSGSGSAGGSAGSGPGEDGRDGASGSADPSPREQDDVRESDADRLGPVARSMRRLVRDETRSWRLLVLGDGTGDDEVEWVRAFADRVAEETGRPVYLRTWSVQSGDYGEPVEAATGQGAPVEVFNASAEGQGPAYSRENLPAMAPPEPADLVVVSHGHNIDDPGTAVAELDALTDAVRDRWPRAGLAVTLQNPRLDGEEDRHRLATAAIREEYQNRSRVALVRVRRAFQQSGDVAGLVADSVVPNPAGSALWADTAWASLTAAD